MRERVTTLQNIFLKSAGGYLAKDGLLHMSEWVTLRVDYLASGLTCEWITLRVDYLASGSPCEWIKLGVDYLASGLPCEWITLRVD